MEDLSIRNIINLKRGSTCSRNGNKYERFIHNILKKTTLNGIFFNTQSEGELGGSTKKNDMECNFYDNKKIGIEIKKEKSPDWMQCSLKYCEETKQWKGSKKGKIPEKSRDIFDRLLRDIELFNGNIPPFMKKRITYSEWLNFKKSNEWNDIYINIPTNTIKFLYQAKGCYYIQVENYGLYHLGDDICNFNVPEFLTKQRLRIRIKVHATKNKKGYCSLSVTAACKPAKIALLKKSPYSLDNIDKLPITLKYIN